MADEAKRIEYWARTWDTTYRKRARRWSGWNTMLVFCSAAFAAVAGATGLGNVWSGSLGPGLFALVAAVASGVAGAVGASTRSTQYNTSAASNSNLADEARVFRTTVVDDHPIAEVSKAFEELCKHRDAVVSNAPVSSPPSKLSQAELAAWPPMATRAP
jgi:hypothetical protein